MAEYAILNNLTMDQKLEAFEKARAKFNIPGVKLVLITEEYYDIALKFTRDSLVPHEPLDKAFGVSWSPDYEAFWLDLLQFNLSLMFLNEENDEPMAIRMTRVVRYDDKTDLESMKTPAVKEMTRFCDYGAKQADFFGHYGITEAFHFLGLAVADRYKKRGLATQIYKSAIDMIRNFGIDPVYVKVEGSSNFAKKIYENANFETLYELPFATWEVDGKFPLLNTGIHKSMKVYSKKLTAES